MKRKIENKIKFFFFFISAIYYTECSGRLWQLLCNYIHSDWSNMKEKEKKKKQEKGEYEDKKRLNDPLSKSIKTEMQTLSDFYLRTG